MAEAATVEETLRQCKAWLETPPWPQDKATPDAVIETLRNVNRLLLVWQSEKSVNENIAFYQAHRRVSIHAGGAVLADEVVRLRSLLLFMMRESQ